MNDLFFYIKEAEFANFADDNAICVDSKDFDRTFDNFAKRM